jgi:hypothetical protein
MVGLLFGSLMQAAKSSDDPGQVGMGSGDRPYQTLIVIEREDLILRRAAQPDLPPIPPLRYTAKALTRASDAVMLECARRQGGSLASRKTRPEE